MEVERFQDIITRLNQVGDVNAPPWAGTHWSNTLHEQMRRHLREHGAQLYSARKAGGNWVIPKDNVPAFEDWIRSNFS